MTIAITNNYHQDKAAAVKAGIIPANAMPKKAALYDAIAEYNATQEQPKTDAERRAEIIAQAEAEWAVEDNTAHDWDGALAKLNKQVLDDPNASVAEYEQAANSGKVISLYGFSQAIRRERQEEKAVAAIELNKEALETGNDFDDLFSRLEQKQEEKKAQAAAVEVIEEIPTNCVEVKDGDDFADLFSQWEQKQEEKKATAAKQPKQPKPAIEWSQEDLGLAQSIGKVNSEHFHKASQLKTLIDKYSYAAVSEVTGIKDKQLRRHVHVLNLLARSEKVEKAFSAGNISWNQMIQCLQKPSDSIENLELKLGLI